MNSKFFTIEDIFCYKGIQTSSFNWLTKWKYMDFFFKDIKQIGYNKHFIVFGLPFMSSNGINDFIEHIKTIPYKIFRIQIRNFHTTNYSDSMPFKNLQPIHKFETIKPLEIIKPLETIKPLEIIKQFETNKIISSHLSLKQQASNQNLNINKVIFEVRPDIQNDIYHLYCYDNEERKNLIHYSVALIPNIETSVKMNKLFRNIKENENMDLMEESDSEDEFENNREDKYVFLERKYKMFCTFHKKLIKWIPEKIANETLIISTIYQVKSFV
jgi:hypothetical protein